MWDDASQRCLDELQRRAEHEPLSADDQRTLEGLLHTLEEAEWAAMRPAPSGLQRDQEALATELSRFQAQHAVVAALNARYADLLTRARTQLATLTSERDVLRREYERAVR